jgi:hypothetical protein
MAKNVSTLTQLNLSSVAGLHRLLPRGMECLCIRFFIEFDPTRTTGEMKDLGRIDQGSRRGDAALGESSKIGQPEGASANFLARCPRHDIIRRYMGEAVRASRILTSLPQFLAEAGVDPYRLKGVDDGEDDGSVGLLDIPQVGDAVF